MSLSLLVIAYKEQPPAEPLLTEMDEGTLTIGRSSDNNWTLPDPANDLSRRHAVIEYIDFGYTLTDVSSNGVYLLPSATPIGRNNSTNLNDGDKIRMGDYEILVSVDSPKSDTGDPMDKTVPPADDFDFFNTGSASVSLSESNSDRLMDNQANEGAFQEQQDELPVPKSFTSAAEEDPFDFFNNNPQDQVVGSAEPDHVPTLDAAFEIAQGAPELVEAKTDPIFEPEPKPLPAQEPDQRFLPDNWFDTEDSNEAEQGESEIPVSESSSEDPFADILNSANETIAEDAPSTEPKLSAEDVSQTPIDADSTESDDEKIEEKAINRSKPPEIIPDIEKPEPKPTATAPDPSRISNAPQQRQLPDESTSSDDKFMQFLAGAGLPEDITHQMGQESFYIIGKMLRGALQGTMDVLLARAEIKNEMRLDVTTIRSAKNNPIKFSYDAEEALLRLLAGDENKGYMDPIAAIDEAFEDIRAHQIAVLAGMQTALQTILKRFDPAILETRLQKLSPISASIPIHKQAKLWEHFQQLYEDIELEAKDDFNRLFGHAFADAYEEQMQKLKQRKI